MPASKKGTPIATEPKRAKTSRRKKSEDDEWYPEETPTVTTVRRTATRSRKQAAAESPTRFEQYDNHDIDSSEESGIPLYFAHILPRPFTPFFLFFVFTLLVYLKSAYPTVAGGDSGELVVSAYQWAPAHPPGYPLLMSMSQAALIITEWASIPSSILYSIMSSSLFNFSFPSVAWRVSIVSQFCGSVSALFIAFSVYVLTKSAHASVASAAIFAFQPLVWSYTTHLEVFPLNNMLIAIVLYLITRHAAILSIKPAHSEQSHFLFPPLEMILCGFLFGASLANQHTAVIFMAPFALWVLIATTPRLTNFTCILVLFLSFVAGFSINFLMLFMQEGRKVYLWGDTTTIDGWLTHLLRKEYGTLSLYKGSAEGAGMFMKWYTYFVALHQNTLYIGIPLAAFGLYSLLKHKNEKIRSLAICLSICLLLYIGPFFYLCNLPIGKNKLMEGVFWRFFQQPNIIISILIGYGLSVIRSKMEKLYKTGSAFLLVFVLLQPVLYYSSMNRSEANYIWHYGHAFIDPLPKNSILLVKGDLIANSVAYLQFCEGARPDLKVLSLEHMTYDWFKPKWEPTFNGSVVLPGKRYHPYMQDGYSIKTFLDANIRKSQIFLAGGWKENDYSYVKHYTTYPFGLTEKILRVDEYYPDDIFLQNLRSALPSKIFPLPDYNKYTADTWEGVVLADYWNGQHFEALWWLNKAIKEESNIQANFNAAQECTRRYENIIKQYPIAGDFYYLNLGLCYNHLKNHLKAEQRDETVNKMLRSFYKFVQSAPPENEDSPKVLRTIEEWRKFLKDAGKPFPDLEKDE